MTTLFISDLHLDASRPVMLEAFEHFIRDEAVAADALYILGDLFEAWIGDDAGDPIGERFITAMGPLREAGTPSFFIHGNRDFLLGEDFARRADMTLLPDPSIIDIEGTRTLLMHGDTLCTDDARYQAFRAQVHSPAWQRAFLARSVDERQAFAVQARSESQRYTTDAGNTALMDVNQDAVREVMRRHGCLRLIHGHTHRPAVHRFELDEKPAERIVLGDWYDQESWYADST
jgi:UDP-2,3-diacylglucosamine hydrolase